MNTDLSLGHPAAVSNVAPAKINEGWWRGLRRGPVFSIVFISLLVIATVFAPLVAPYGPEEGTLRESRVPPLFFGGSTSHILGTDAIGRDVLSRTIYGSRISLLVAGAVLVISGSFGVSMGLLSGYVGGWVDEVIMRVVDALNSIPLILIALVVAAKFGASLGALLVLLSIWLWGGYARLVRGETLTLRETGYVQLAKIAGASMPRILFRHIFPGVLSTATVIATFSVGGVILTEASLSYLGAGIPPPSPAWGGQVAAGQRFLSSAWWIAIFPGLAIGLTVMAFVFLGDWLRDYTDPKLRQQL